MKPSKITFGAKQGKDMFAKKQKPTKIDYPDGPANIERDSEIELNALQIAFREKAKKEKELQDQNTEGDFFSCIVFKTQEQRDQFYQLLNIKGDDLQYVNGDKLIKALELQIQEVNMKTPGKFKCNKDILSLSLNPNF